MKRILGFALLVVCLVPSAALCASLNPPSGNVPLPIWLTDDPPGGVSPDPGPVGQPITYSCIIHCGNDKTFSGALDPAACCAQYNTTCDHSGGNITCSPSVPYTPIPPGDRCGGYIIAADPTGSTSVPTP